ncbi:MAG: hypothetical protein ACPLY7_00230 [Microgenomates group bacterium]
MYKKIRIAFDLDGVIVDKPPLIPKRLIEWLFRGWKKDGLHYRFPKSKLEQRIRKISHFYLFRPPIRKNIEFIRQLAKEKKYELYIISARYSFLKDETEKWLKKRNINGIFKEVFINLSDEQPHLFKEEKLKEIKAEIFVDDDYLLADYLAQKNFCRIFCYSKNIKCSKAKVLEELSQLFK